MHKCALFSAKAAPQSFGDWGCTLPSDLRSLLGRGEKSHQMNMWENFLFILCTSLALNLHIESISFHYLSLVEKVGQSFSPLQKNWVVLGWLLCSRLWVWRENYLKNYSATYVLGKPQTPFQKCSHVYVIAQSLAIGYNHSSWDNISRGILSSLSLQPFPILVVELSQNSIESLVFSFSLRNSYGLGFCLILSQAWGGWWQV